MTRIPSRKNPIHHENAPIVLPHDAALSPLSRSQDTIPRGLGFVLAAAVAALPISSEVAPLRRPPDPGSASPFVSSVAIKQSPTPPPAFPLRRRRPIQFVSGAAGRTAPSFVFNPLPPSREPAPTDAQADQVDAGHRPTKYLTPAGYKGLMKEFHAQTGRNYEKKQFKNRWDDMKTIYCAWVFYKNKATGLGWDDVTQTVTADDAQWDAMIKVHKAIRAFRKGPPDNVKQLLMMFGGANVDGLSSVMPGVDDDYEEEEEEEEQAQGEPPVETEQEVIELYDEENEPPAPVQPKAKRKKASTIPCSPSKPKKNNVPKDFKRFVDHVIQEDRAGQTSKNTDNDDILAIMEEVAKCGASETSDEYYIATKLFAKPSNRSFFYAMKTTEGRLNWLKRQFEDRKK